MGAVEVLNGLEKLQGIMDLQCFARLSIILALLLIKLTCEVKSTSDLFSGFLRKSLKIELIDHEVPRGHAMVCQDLVLLSRRKDPEATLSSEPMRTAAR